ncbi:hypothetical protein LCGC14_1198280 [marine sediment metagenome]|uniref:Uncharacterized protein n=1 Tax=marine sediment metagenome TaxID=412755 RepID=A0A0F9M504_9ZZZZ
MTFQFEEFDELYCWIYDEFKGKKPEGERYISRSFFINRLNDFHELSTDWDKKTNPSRNPHETRARKGAPEKYGVLFFAVGALRSLDVTIHYTPKPDNPAHSDIRCDPSLSRSLITQLARKIRELADWKIYFTEPVLYRNGTH